MMEITAPHTESLPVVVIPAPVVEERPPVDLDDIFDVGDPTFSIFPVISVGGVSQAVTVFADGSFVSGWMPGL
jgi:hypothetical protein